MNEEYLVETKTIDYRTRIIREKVLELRNGTESTIVSRKASEVLENKTGICWTKSCLLAALLRANGIPSGISYQLLTRADNDDSEGYIENILDVTTDFELN